MAPLFFQSTNENVYANLDCFLFLHIQSAYPIDSLITLKSIPSFSFSLTSVQTLISPNTDNYYYNNLNQFSHTYQSILSSFQSILYPLPLSSLKHTPVQYYFTTQKLSHWIQSQFNFQDSMLSDPKLHPLIVSPKYSSTKPFCPNKCSLMHHGKFNHRCLCLQFLFTGVGGGGEKGGGGG